MPLGEGRNSPDPELEFPRRLAGVTDPRDELATFRELAPEPPAASRMLAAQAKIYEGRINVAFLNGNPVGHSGRAFEEISTILAELEARIVVLEP